MKLAIGSVVAFAGLGAELYGDPAIGARRARWWRDRGAEGVVCYDNLPGFYEIPLSHVRVLKAALDEAGLPVPAFNALRKSLHLPDYAEEEDRRLEHCLAVCEILRPTVLDLSVCNPLGSTDVTTRPIDNEMLERVAARLKRLARTCGDLGMQLAIELHDEGIHDDAVGCLRLVELIDEPNVGVNPDLGNWYRRPDRAGIETWRSQLAPLAPKTVYWEVKNYQRLAAPGLPAPVSWPVELDAGEIDYREATEVLWRSGFRGWVCHEGGAADRIRSNVRYLVYMRWVLDEWIGAGLE